MGIKGLSTFLGKYHSQYNETIYIHDCPIVIDGNNLMYFLLQNPRVPNAHLVGGDNVLYSKRVREFFQHLKDCKITPIVIFDGAYEPEKWKTVFKRYKENLKKNVHSTMPGNAYTPVSMSPLFREILVEQGILHYQTEFEGDDTMAFIAKKLNCPLLSSDSDFYIYPDIQNVTLGSIEFRKSMLKKSHKNAPPAPQKAIHVLAAKVLSLKKLCNKEFKFQDLRLLPLAAVILGNDRISSRTFSTVSKGKGALEKEKRIKYVFNWLGKHRDYDHVVSVILHTLKETERNEIHNLVKDVLLNYEGENGEIRVWNSVIQDLKLDFKEEDPPSPEYCPEWYLPQHTNSTLPTYLLQILKNKTVLLQPQVEISHLPSTHVPSIDIVRVTAGILLGQSEITLITRERKNVIRLEIKTITEIPGFGPLPTIFEKNFKNKAQAIIQSAFQLTFKEIEFTNQWPKHLKFLIMALLFFCKKVKKSKSTRPMALAILSVYLKQIFKSNKKTVKSKESSESLSVSECIGKQNWTSSLDCYYSRFDTSLVCSKQRPYEISYVTLYSQFQCILVHSMMTCKLLGNPFPLPKLQYLNSHFIYNATQTIDLIYFNHINEFFQFNFCPENDSMLVYIFYMFFYILDITPRLQEEKSVEQPLDENSDDVSSASSDETSEDDDDEVNVEISNRFSKLKV